ncbi:MAG: DUF1566 domain-containing protein [Nitrospirae bacterium]|nr:DUF1566 domain-containing protein [Nitrospirota bacterium]
MTKKIFMIMVLMLLAANAVFAADAEVAETGQTPAAPIVAPAGSDGDLQKGVALANPRFTDLGDGTVRDNVTGLIWTADANCDGTQRTWATAVAFANTLNAGECGLTVGEGSLEGDWRLPNRKELRTLIDFSKFNPAVTTGHPFGGVQNSAYWTSSSSGTSNSWSVDMGTGISSLKAVATTYYVWPVKGKSVSEP